MGIVLSCLLIQFNRLVGVLCLYMCVYWDVDVVNVWFVNRGCIVCVVIIRECVLFVYCIVVCSWFVYVVSYVVCIYMCACMVCVVCLRICMYVV